MGVGPPYRRRVRPKLLRLACADTRAGTAERVHPIRRRASGNIGNCLVRCAYSSGEDPLANQADADRKVKLGPCSIGGEYLCRDAPNGERQAAAVAQ